jgi:formylglycine-generating enzyme required for sulfatase activity
MIESILSICSGAKTAYDTYKTASAIIKGDPQVKLLEEIAKQTGDMKVHIERLSDNILYAPNMQAVQAVNPSRRQQVQDLREVRETLDPLQRALGENIFSSAMILTPDKMRQAMVKDPWDVLDDIRPFNRATPHHDPAKIPILFDDNDVRYIGWMKRGLLPVVFEIEWRTSQIIQTPNPPPKSPEDSFNFEMVTVDQFGRVRNRQTQSNKQQLVDLGKGVKLEMVSIPKGSFQMGSNNYDSEKPIHEVKIEKAFWMGKYPVTVGQFKRFVEETRYQTTAEKEDGAYVYISTGSWEKKKDANWRNPYFKQTDKHPVVCVSWIDAVKFCEWLSIETDKKYRLPTEAEWEYACRAGTTTPFHFGETITTDLVNYDGNYPYGDAPKGEYRKQTVEVDYFKHANNFGLYQMHGNVWEWTCSDYGNYSENNHLKCSSKNNTNKVLRGGSWGSNAEGCRSSYRNFDSGRYDGGGFRLAFFLFPQDS